MSNEILPTFGAIKSTIDSTKQQPKLCGASRVHALERELEQLDQITASVDGVIGSIEATSANMDVILSTTNSTNKLLDLWIKILSQTSYTTNLLSDKNWKGLTRNEEEYQAQLKRFDELNNRFNAEKQKKEQQKEQEKETVKQKRLAQEQRIQEREESLKRRVYGRGSSSRPTTSTQKTPSKGASSARGSTRK